MGRVLHLGPSWHGPSFMWAELAWDELVLGRVVLHPGVNSPTAVSFTVASFIRLAARVAVEVAEGGKLARYKTALEQIALGKMASISW